MALAGQTRDRPSRLATYKPLKLVTAPRLTGGGASLSSVVAFNLARDGVSLAGNNSLQLVVARLWPWLRPSSLLQSKHG